MNFFARTFLLLGLMTLNLLGAEPWPGVKYAEARAYAWPGDKSMAAVILPGMKLAPGVINKDGALLTAEQAKSVAAAVTGEHKAYTQSRCHEPHNAIVFYDAEKKPVAYLEICFKCLTFRSEPKTTAKWNDVVELARIFDEHKLPMGRFANLEAFKKSFERNQEAAKGK